MGSESAANSPLLEVRNLSVSYSISRGGLWGKSETMRAVDDASFSIARGKTLGLVGESGSGKSTIGKAISKLVTIESGEINYAGECISSLSDGAFMPYRKRIQTIFQDPFGSMNPRLPVGTIIAEPLMVHERSMSVAQRTERVVELLETVGLPADSIHRYPHQFSGGQRQRICIARALSARPEFIICDECVSALDVSVQAQIVNLLMDLQDEFGITYLFIAHDLAVVEHVSHEVAVMQKGRIVESGSAKAIYSNPKTEYTQNLLEAIPSMPSIGTTV